MPLNRKAVLRSASTDTALRVAGAGSPIIINGKVQRQDFQFYLSRTGGIAVNSVSHREGSLLIPTDTGPKKVSRYQYEKPDFRIFFTKKTTVALQQSAGQIWWPPYANLRPQNRRGLSVVKWSREQGRSRNSPLGYGPIYRYLLRRRSCRRSDGRCCLFLSGGQLTAPAYRAATRLPFP